MRSAPRTFFLPRTRRARPRSRKPDRRGLDAAPLRLEDRTVPAPVPFVFSFADPSGAFAPYPGLLNILNSAGQILGGAINGNGSANIQVQVVPNNNDADVQADTPIRQVDIDPQGVNWKESFPLQEIRTGVDNTPDADLVIGINAASYLKNDAWIDPSGAARTAPVPPDKSDLLSLVLRELVHGLGVLGYHKTDGTLAEQSRTTFDRLGTRNAGADSSGLFDGSNAVAANGGSPIPLAAIQSSDFLSDSDTNVYYTNLPNDLLNRTLPDGARRGLSAVDLGILADLGVAPAQVDRTSLSVDEGVGNATITVNRVGPPGSFVVHYETSDGTAKAGEDYTATSGTLSFGELDSSKTFTIPIRDDIVAEPDETINITLKDPGDGHELDTAALTIRDNDRPVTLHLSLDDDSGTLGDGITSINQPHLEGTANPGLALDLINGAGNVVTSGTVADDGTFQLQFPSPLPDGTMTLRARVHDNAGNTATSAPLTLTIDTTRPTATLALSSTDDTGAKGDGTTTVHRPLLVGTTEPNALVELLDPSDQVLATTTALGNGQFSVRFPGLTGRGRVTLRVRASDVAGNVGDPSKSFSLTILPGTPGDYDGDGKADITVYRTTTGQWIINQSSGAGLRVVPFGAPRVDIPLLGDFDGDGKADIAVYRPTFGLWIISPSGGGVARIVSFGLPNVDIPVPADYDGDGKTDIAVYRPTTGQWVILPSSGGIRLATFGAPNLDRPVPADYDGDGKADIAIYRPTTGLWAIAKSAGGTQVAAFGRPTVDVPVPVDYDGDGKADIAVYRATIGQWLISQPTGGVRIVAFGLPNADVPVLTPLAYRYKGSLVHGA